MKNKKLLPQIIFFSLIFFLSVGLSFAQTSLSGTQTRGSAGNNAELSCTPINLAKTVTINKVTGDNAGFWIQKDGVAIMKFWNPNDQGVIGKKLDKGTYYVFPNLKANHNKATVTLYFK